MNEDGPPAQTYLHKHGVLIKDQLYYNAYLSGEMKGSRSDHVLCAEIQNESLRQKRPLPFQAQSTHPIVCKWSSSSASAFLN